MREYTVNKRIWNMCRDLKDHESWGSMWFCDDGDGISLYIQKNGGGFSLECFSGIPSSNVYIDSVDFGTLWRKAFPNIPFENYTYKQQCITLADWICSKFCEWIDTSNYKNI